MANFSTALEALGSGVVSLETISVQLKSILEQTPDYSQHLLSRLLIARDKNIIEDPVFFSLKNIIEPYLIDANPININDSFSNNFIDLTSENTQQELSTGSIIKQRFKLLEMLGFGGMGRVYKCIDLLKQEAKDKNPYVAIKLLNEDFKSHPNAFISLQRESSRQQKLAHPNIATVYDFDRVGDRGSPVFITMELLEGQTLSIFIKRKLRRLGGLPFSEAFKIIKQLGSALSYAHEQGIVHSDFKPANAFICNDGTVKTLDFGIARAVKSTVEGESERTLFDPRNLGAFTPAYASLEMLLGKEPDTRDDIYALACVSYELLTGKHPYDKKPATYVKEHNIIPTPIKGLSKKQNLTLQKSLAPNRENRCQSVEQFLIELEDKYIWYKDIKTVSALILLPIIIGLYSPFKAYLKQQEIETITQNFKSDNHVIIDNTINRLSKLKQVDQLSIINNSKNELQHYFSEKIKTLINIETNHFDFIKAEKVLSNINDFYPGSNYYIQEKTKTEENKQKILNKLYQQLNLSLKNIDSFETSKSILNTIKTQVDPNHALLREQQLAIDLNELAKRALENNVIDTAESIASITAELFPHQDDTKSIIQDINNKKAIANVYSRLEDVSSKTLSLDDYKKYQKDIHLLSNLDPDNVLLSIFSHEVSSLTNAFIAQIKTSNNVKKLDAFYNNHSNLLESLNLHEQLLELSLLNSENAEQDLIIQNTIDETQNSLDNLIALSNIEKATWTNQIRSKLTKLSSIENKLSINTNYETYSKSISDLYIDAALDSVKNSKFDQALSYLDTANDFFSAHPEISNIRHDIRVRLSKYQIELEISDLKRQFDLQIQANELEQSKATLALLKQRAKAHDYYLETYAPKKISELYSIKAQSFAQTKDFQNALEQTNQGLAFYPINQVLLNQKRSYLIEIYSDELQQSFKENINFDTNDILRKFGEIEAVNPDLFINLRQKSTKILVNRINDLKKTDLNRAMILAQNAANIFPGSIVSQLHKELIPEPWPDKNIVETLLKDGKLSQAQTIIATASEPFAQHPEYTQAQNQLSQKINTAQEEYKKFILQKKQANDNQQKLIQAELQLQKARALWTDNEEYSKANRKLLELITLDKPTKRPASTALIEKEHIDFVGNTSNKDTLETKQTNDTTWQPISSGRECHDGLASYGRRAKAVCFDLVNATWRGPLMVVVPTNETFAQSFAISKYEISVNDYSKYCYISGQCRPETNKKDQDFPITNIRFDDALNYANWLSLRTGKKYRIPTENEWRYAALASGKPFKKDVNCRLTIGEKMVKGANLINIKSGEANDWGLKNHIGNAQEWVKDDKGNIIATGGAYTDAMSKCDIDLKRPHSGSNDQITGFRIILEME